MKVAVTGSSGLIGRALYARLTAEGHGVTRVVRSSPRPGEILWDPRAGRLDPASLEGHDAVVNLAGAGIGDHRWTDAHKAEVRASRVEGTTLLAGALASLDRPPGVFASGSAVGFYGDRGDEELTEASGPGEGFLAEVVGLWEASTAAAEQAGVRVAHLRTGIVLSPDGGALGRQLLPFKLGVGGRLGSGRQYTSWISIDDEVAAIEHVLTTPSLRGPVNLCAPGPVTSAQFAAVLGRVLHRPALLPVPTLALRALFGSEMTDDMLLAGQRVVPAALHDSGYRFRHSDLEAALRAVLDRRRP